MEEWLKRHRLLSAIGGVVGMIIATLAAVDVIWGLFSDEPLLPYISANAPQWVRVLLAILFVAICIFCMVIVRKVYRQTKIPPQPEIEKKSLTDILTAMHRRLIELQREKAAHTKVSFEVFKKVLPTLAYRMDKVEQEEWSAFENDIKSKIRQAIPPKPYISIRGRFNFKKWARLNAQWKERVYLRASFIAREAKDELFNAKNWTLADGMKIAEWADGYGWGIKELRDNDPQWKGLYESIDNHLRIDDVLGGLIKDHIDVSHVYNNITLMVHISDKFKDDIYSLILYEALVGGPMSPEQVDMGLNEILGKIEKRLKEMADE
jgi:hypothetical protein